MGRFLRRIFGAGRSCMFYRSGFAIHPPTKLASRFFGQCTESLRALPCYSIASQSLFVDIRITSVFSFHIGQCCVKYWEYLTYGMTRVKFLCKLLPAKKQLTSLLEVINSMFTQKCLRKFVRSLSRKWRSCLVKNVGYGNHKDLNLTGSLWSRHYLLHCDSKKTWMFQTLLHFHESDMWCA